MRLSAPTPTNTTPRDGAMPSFPKVPWPFPHAPEPPVVPGPELPPVQLPHPRLPFPVPGLQDLAKLAVAVPSSQRFRIGTPPSGIHNAHYSNKRAQLGYALTHDYNSFEGDVRLRDGRAVMLHDGHGAYDLTFDQWATITLAAGKHLRIDIKEHAALPSIEATLRRLHVPPGQITFNVGVESPWSASNTKVAEIRSLQARYPGAWVTLNLPLPGTAGAHLVARAAAQLGPSHLGVAITEDIARTSDVTYLRRWFEAVNVWNVAQLGGVVDPAAVAQRMRDIGVNGMIDLRRSDDPLADD